MNSEQQTYIDFINRSSHKELFIKKTGREGISLPVHSHDKHQIIYTLSGTLRIQTESTNYFVPEQHLVWIPQNVEHELSSNNRQISLLMFYVALDLPEEDTRQQFGIYSTYLNYQRITRAIELFADGDKTMQQIAYEVGFNTPQ